MNDIEISLRYKVFKSQEQLDPHMKKLSEASIRAAGNAYAPYSKFNVGAAILLDSGEIVTGNNQENAAYPSGLCAERVAVFAASALNPDMKIKAIAVFAKGEESNYEEPVTPCGACRQALLEYENRQGTDIPVFMIGVNGKVLNAPSIKSLLPLSFGSFQLTGNR